MLKREAIIQELERRMWTITTANGYPLSVVDVKRNPGLVDSAYPCVNIYEMPDRVVEANARGNQPTYKRQMQVVIEMWREFSDDRAASQEIIEFYNCVRWAVYIDGISLGRLGAQIRDDEATQIIKPVRGNTTVGIGISFLVQYVDELVNPIT